MLELTMQSLGQEDKDIRRYADHRESLKAQLYQCQCLTGGYSYLLWSLKPLGIGHAEQNRNPCE